MKRFTLAAVLLMLVACGGGGSAPATPSTPTTPTTPTVTTTSVAVTGTGCTSGICAGQVGGTLQLRATATMSNGTTQDVTSQASWSSSNATVATVSSGGLVTFRAAGDADILATYQGKLDGQTVRLTPAGPKTSFGAGQYLVGKDIAAGRYYTDPASGCYWERQSGLGGSLNDILANDFVGFDAAQLIVDIRAGDLAFKTESSCGTWNQSPRGGLQASITPGVWLINTQITPGTYRAQVVSGCYWERLRNFDGTLSAIAANDFVSSAGQQLVSLAAGDVGFNTNNSCGSWTRISSTVTNALTERVGGQTEDQVAANWRAHRATVGLRR